MNPLYNWGCREVNPYSCLSLNNKGCKFGCMTLADRLKKARSHAKLTQEGLAERSGVKQQVISKIESGRQQTTSFTVELAVACGVRPQWLSSGQEPMLEMTTEAGSTPNNGYANVKSVLRSRRSIIVLNYVQAGMPREVVDDYAPGEGMAELEVGAKIADELGPSAFALEIEGDSMEPEFVAGDHVIIDPDVSPRPGDYVVAKLERENAATFKKYRSRGIDSAGREVFELVALNEDYLPIQVNGTNPGYVIGTMIEHRRYRRR